MFTHAARFLLPWQAATFPSGSGDTKPKPEKRAKKKVTRGKAENATKLKLIQGKSEDRRFFSAIPFGGSCFVAPKGVLSRVREALLVRTVGLFREIEKLVQRRRQNKTPPAAGMERFLFAAVQINNPSQYSIIVVAAAFKSLANLAGRPFNRALMVELMKMTFPSAIMDLFAWMNVFLLLLLLADLPFPMKSLIASLRGGYALICVIVFFYCTPLLSKSNPYNTYTFTRLF